MAGFKGKIRDKDKGYERILHSLRIADRSVVVGVRQGSGGAQKFKTIGGPFDRQSVPGGDQTLAEVAAANEFGTWNVPERSFMRSTFDHHEGDYSIIMHKGVQMYIDGREKLDTVLSVVGLRITSDIQTTMTELETPRNSIKTIMEKNSDNPLIDTGRLRQSISYELRDAGAVPAPSAEHQ